MKLRNRAVCAVLTVGMAVGSVVAAAPAQAAAAPSCVQLYQNNNNVQVTNGCRSGVRVKVVWAFATDGPCTYISPYNTKFFEKKGWPARLDGLQTC